MKVIYLICINLFLLLEFVAPQSITQLGIIKFQNSQNKPVIGAQIKALWANPKISNSKGEFELQFVGKEAGSEVSITIDFEGYEVVNKKETIFNLNPHKKIQIFLCKKGEWERNAIAYYNINLNRLQSSYNRKIKSLTSIKGNSADSLNLLEVQFKEQLKQLREISEYFAKIDLDATDSLTIKLFIEFRKGNYTNFKNSISIESLNSLAEKYKRTHNQGYALIKVGQSIIQESNDELKKLGELYIIGAQSSYLESKFDSAISYYENYIKFDTSNRIVNLKYALLLIEQRNEKAERISQKIISANIWRIDSVINSLHYTNSNFAILNNLNFDLQFLFAAQKDFTNAKKIYDKILSFYTKISDPSIESVLNYANNLSNAAQVSISYKEYYDSILGKNEFLKQKKLIQQFNTAYFLIDSLERVTKNKYLKEKINILFAWANFYNDGDLIPQAITLFRLCSDLENQNTIIDSTHLIENYNGIVICFQKLRVFDSAYLYSNKALNILVSISNIDSIQYIENFLKIKKYQLYTQYLSGNIDVFKKSLVSLTKLYEKLYDNNFNRYGMPLHSHYKTAVQFLAHLDDYDMTLAYLQADLKVLQRFNLTIYIQEVCANMSLIYRKKGDFITADSLLNLSIRLLDNFIKQTDYSSVGRYQLYCYKKNLAENLFAEKKFEQSLDSLIPLRKDLIEINQVENSAYSKQVLEITNLIITVYLSMYSSKRDTLSKIEALRDCIYYEELAAKMDSSSLKLYVLSSHYLDMHLLKGEINLLEKGLEYAKLIYRRNNFDVEKLLMAIYAALISHCSKDCQHAEVLKYSKEAVLVFPNSIMTAYLYVYSLLLNSKNNYEPFIQSWSASIPQKRNSLLEIVNSLQESRCITKKGASRLRKLIPWQEYTK